MKTKLLLLSALMLLLCSCGLLPEEKQRQQAPVLEEYAEDPYTYVTVQRGTVTDRVSAGAAVVAVDTAAVSFEDTKRPLDACLVSLGQKVSVGEVLCTLQAEDLAEQLVELQTELALQQLELDYCKRCNELDLEKEEILLSRMGSQSQKAEKQAQIDSLKREFEAQEQALQVQLDELQAQYDALQHSYEQCTLVAPMDGTVTKISSDRRSYEISDLSDCLLEINQKDADLFPAGTRVELTLDDQVQIGTVLTAAEAGREGSKGVFVLPDEPDAFSGTSRWTASYVAAQVEDALFLPTSALRVAGGVDCVYIIGENGLITTCEITAGISGGGNTQILSGLEEGQQVILKY